MMMIEKSAVERKLNAEISEMQFIEAAATAMRRAEEIGCENEDLLVAMAAEAVRITEFYRSTEVRIRRLMMGLA